MRLVNIDIPGWNSFTVLEILSKYAADVPENGIIIELGAFLGRTTYTLGTSKKPSVKLITIDDWKMIYMNDDEIFHDNLCNIESCQKVNSFIKDNPKRIDGDDFFQLWKDFTQCIVNSEYVRDRTDLNNTNYPMADFIYHDAGHSYEDVYNDLCSWFPKLKQHGTFIIDDYRDSFPDLVRAVDQFAIENKLTVEIITPGNALIRKYEQR